MECGKPELIRVITRFHPGEMCAGVSDLEALRLLLEAGAQIRGIRGLHAKVYLFGQQRAIVTSANLTEAALLRNHEFGFVSSEAAIIKRCGDYFDQLWPRAGPNLEIARLEGWERQIAAAKLAGNPPSAGSALKDEGAVAGASSAGSIEFATADDATQAFVKFFGQGSDRAPLDLPVLEEVDSSGSHWACTYPANKRPRRVQDGDVMFMGRLVENPHDIVIYGRAIGLHHIDGRDMASPEDIARRSWKEDWPAYVRVHSAEFVAGTLRNGVRLSALMDALQSDSFVSTQRNHKARAGGNTDPRRAMMQKAHMQLTRQAFAWVESRLREAFERHGKLTPAELGTLDWPDSAVPDFDAYEVWLVRTEGLKEVTAREYAYFLKRCLTHYPVKLNPTTVPTVSAADAVLAEVERIVAQKGRWADGTFNERDLSQNLRPALRAYGRFNASQSLI